MSSHQSEWEWVAGFGANHIMWELLVCENAQTKDMEIGYILNDWSITVLWKVYDFSLPVSIQAEHCKVMYSLLICTCFYLFFIIIPYYRMFCTVLQKWEWSFFLFTATQIPDLIGDFSKPFILPLIEGRHQDLKTISADTLSSLLNGNFSEEVESYTVVDCR
jgi:hypothetical protein